MKNEQSIASPQSLIFWGANSYRIQGGLHLKYKHAYLTLYFKCQLYFRCKHTHTCIHVRNKSLVPDLLKDAEFSACFIEN